MGGRTRKRPTIPFPPDPDYTVKVGHNNHKDTKRWCRGVVGREHRWTEPMDEAVRYAEEMTTKPRDRYSRWGVFWKVSLRCENCLKYDWWALPRHIWTNERDFMDIPYHAHHYTKWDRYYAEKYKR